VALPDAKDDLEATPDDEGLRGSEPGPAMLRLVLGFAALLVAVALVSWRFRDPLERFGRAFVDQFGTWGMGAGAFLADGLHFPLPPQFYLFAGIAGGAGRVTAMGSVLAGSVLGGLVAFALARRLTFLRAIAVRTRAPRFLVAGLFERHGYRGLVIAGMMPVSYWMLCTLSGVLRMPYRAYAVLAVMRVPRLVLSYLVIDAAWTFPAP
jgi:membrane protein YqaA with SNARE-associated domain